jgi:hypothetical protein
MTTADAAELNAYLERCRIGPGSSGAGSVPYKRRHGAAEIWQLDLLDTVGSDVDLAQRATS